MIIAQKKIVIYTSGFVQDFHPIFVAIVVTLTEKVIVVTLTKKL